MHGLLVDDISNSKVAFIIRFHKHTNEVFTTLHCETGI